MSSNYAQLKNKAVAVNAAIETLREKKVSLEHAHREVDQLQKAYDDSVLENIKRQALATTSTADKAALIAEKTTLLSLKTSLTTSVAALKTAMDSEKAAVDTLKAEINAILGVDTAGLPVTPAAGIELLKSEIMTFTSSFMTAQNTLVVDRTAKENKEEELKVVTDNIAELTVTIAGLPVGDAIRVSLETQRTAHETTKTTLEGQIASLVTSINAAVATSKLAEDDLAAKNVEMDMAMNSFRTKQKELSDQRVKHTDAVKAYGVALNSLEDVIGTAVAPEDPLSVPANGFANSKLQLVTTLVTDITDSDVKVQDVAVDVKTMMDDLKVQLDAAKSTLVTTEGEVKVASKTLDTDMKALEVLVAKQKEIEVNASYLVLEDFLKKYAIMTSAGPNVAPEVAPEVELTCDSSKVRLVIAKIRAAYEEPSEYATLLEAFRADPVGSFFSAINDPCFSALSEADVEALRNEIKAEFGKKAAALFELYFPTKKAVSKVSITPFLVILGIVILLLVGVMYFRK